MNTCKLHTTKPWTDTLGKNGVTLLETQLKVALPTRNVQKTLIKPFLTNVLQQKITPCMVLTLFHTTNIILIQGNKKQMRVDKGCQILRAVIKK